MDQALRNALLLIVRMRQKPAIALAGLMLYHSESGDYTLVNDDFEESFDTAEQAVDEFLKAKDNIEKTKESHRAK